MTDKGTDGIRTAAESSSLKHIYTKCPIIGQWCNLWLRTTSPSAKMRKGCKLEFGWQLRAKEAGLNADDSTSTWMSWKAQLQWFPLSVVFAKCTTLMSLYLNFFVVYKIVRACTSSINCLFFLFYHDLASHPNLQCRLAILFHHVIGLAHLYF